MVNPQQSIPEKTFTTKGGKVLTMSYGMFSDVMRILGNPDDAVELLMTDPNLRDLVLRRLFTDAPKAITNTDELISSFDMDLEVLEMDDVIAWIADHVIHFTMSTAKKTTPVVEKWRGKPENDLSLNQSNDG